jgi:hypothetical protein
MTGRWPQCEVDHRNRIKHDDRWNNLREATKAQNSANRGPTKKGKRFKGIYWNRGKYYAQLNIRYRRLYLGRFDTAEEAYAVYVATARKHLGEFARI